MNARFAIALLASMAPLAAHPGPEPIVQMTIDPPRVMVGQPAMLRVEVWAPNYMTSPPVLPDLQLRNAVTRQLQSANIYKQQNGIEYAGVRFEFAIYTLEAGSFAIAGQKLTIKYAAEPPATREAAISLPRIEFQAFIPDAAAGLHPFLTASNLTIEQAIQRSSNQLKVGDAVTRIIAIKAEGTLAMLLPPTAFPTIDGLAVYPAQPSLQDKTVGRNEAMSASRVDSATYMLEKAGDYVLPAIDVRWWNAAEAKVDIAHLDAVPLQVAANPAAASSATSSARWNGLVDLVTDHWLFGLIAVTALVLLARFAPRLTGPIARHHRRRRAAWLESESCYFGRLRHAARLGDARAVYFALLAWLQRFEPTAPLHNLESLKTAARDLALDREIDALQATLFAPHRETADWSPRQLLRRAGAARRTLLRQSARSERLHALPERLNPIRDPAPSHRQWRVPAR